MPTLKVLLLGPPAVYYDDTPLTIQRRSLRIILYYLAQQENMIDRAQLLLALWPDENESTGRRRLRELLSKLRAELPDPDLLVTDQDQIGLDRSRLYVDSIEFDSIFNDCSPMVNTIPRHLPLPERTFQQIRAGIDLWRTPFFMAGAQMPESEDFDRWASETGRILERRRVLLIDRLSDHYAASGDVESALSMLGRILEEEPDNEDWQVRYLTWLNQLNRRSEAITYNEYLLHYYKMRGEKVPERIRNVAQNSNPHPNEKDPDENPLWPPPAQLQTPFVGRQQELHHLAAAFQRGGLLVLWGDGGSGKTRLVYEFSRQIAARSRLFVASAFSSTKDLPYQPILEMLRQGIPEREWKSMPASWIMPLTPLIPELSRLSQSSRMDDTRLGDVQGMIFESLHQVFKSLAKQSRVLVFLDDAHLSDRSSLDVLEYLFTRGFFEQHGLLVISARPDEKSASLEKFIEQARKPAYRFEEFHISDFSVEDTSALMTLMLGRSYPSQAVQQLLEISNGKPLYLVELLRSVMEYSAWVDLEEVIENLPLPKSIRSMVQGRMSTLSSNARRILQVASVTNGSFRPAMLELALELTPEQVVDALDELERQRLVQPAGSSPTGASYGFMYSRIRTIVMADLSEARKRLLHLAVARAMKSIPLESSNPSLIAGHYEAAGELKSAFDYWLMAGNRARELFSRTDAEYAFSRAAALIQYLGSFVTEDEIYRLYASWGDLLNDFYDFKSSLDLFYNLQALGNQRQSHILLGTAFNGLTRVFRNIGEYDRALQYSLQAEEHLKISKLMPEYFSVFTRRAVTCLYLDDYNRALASVQRAVELSAGTQSWRVQIGLSSTFVQMAELCSYKGWLHRTEEICDLGLRSIESTYNNPDIEMIRLKMAQIHCISGYPRKAYMLANQVLKLAAEWNHNRLIGFARQTRAQAELEMGWMGECLEDLEESLNIASQYNFIDLAQRAYNQLGEFYLGMGEVQLANRAHKTALESTTRPYHRLDSQVRYGYTQVWAGNPDDGIETMLKALQEAEAGGFGLIQVTTYSLLANSYLIKGKMELAEDAVMAYKEAIQTADIRIWNLNLKLFEQALKTAAGQPVDEDEILSSVSFSREGGNIWMEISAINQLLSAKMRVNGDISTPLARLKELESYLEQRARRDDVREMITSMFGKITRLYKSHISAAGAD